LFTDIMKTWFEAAQFAADSQRVIALRMMRLSSGGPQAATEARRMVAEKVAAFGEAHGALMGALVNGSSFDAAKKEIEGLRGQVPEADADIDNMMAFLSKASRGIVR